jgi:hypothetical protein
MESKIQPAVSLRYIGRGSGGLRPHRVTAVVRPEVKNLASGSTER